MRFLPYGDSAVLVEIGDVEEGEVDVLRLSASAAGAIGVVEAVPAARTVLVEFDPRLTSIERLEDTIARDAPKQTTPAQAALSPGRAGRGEVVSIDVRYDGADLAQVAREVGLSVEEVIRRHAAPTYLVAFCGFAPGFAYLAGLDPSLRVGRMSQPRAMVPAGSIGIAGEFTGVYPRSSPGGWRLLGRTTATLWDPSRTAPALLAPGTSVRFSIT
ncbi:MAG: allophanate hydrolase subunit 1 [Actinomycetota bacterium]|nr:allophanate hydrolase subunit 1 [Actinomycetota bacterium]